MAVRKSKHLFFVKVTIFLLVEGERFDQLENAEVVGLEVGVVGVPIRVEDDLRHANSLEEKDLFY